MISIHTDCAFILTISPPVEQKVLRMLRSKPQRRGDSLSRVRSVISKRNRSCQRSESLSDTFGSHCITFQSKYLAAQICKFLKCKNYIFSLHLSMPAIDSVLENSSRHLFSTTPLCSTTTTPISTNSLTNSAVILTPTHQICCTATSITHSSAGCSLALAICLQRGERYCASASSSQLYRDSLFGMYLGQCSIALQSRFEILLHPKMFYLSKYYNNHNTNFSTNLYFMQRISSGFYKMVFSNNGVSFSQSSSKRVERRATQFLISSFFFSWKCMIVSRAFSKLSAQSCFAEQQASNLSMHPGKLQKLYIWMYLAIIIGGRISQICSRWAKRDSIEDKCSRIPRLNSARLIIRSEMQQRHSKQTSVSSSEERFQVNSIPGMLFPAQRQMGRITARGLILSCSCFSRAKRGIISMLAIKVKFPSIVRQRLQRRLPARTLTESLS